MSTHIRPVRVSDADAIDSLLSAVHEAATQNHMPIGPRWSREQLEAECSQKGWVISGPDSSIFSFVLFREQPGVWEISFLATNPAACRCGLMSQLLSHMRSVLPPGHEIWLEVHEGNTRARFLYEKIGFVEVGKRLGYYADGGAALLYNYG